MSNDQQGIPRCRSTGYSIQLSKRRGAERRGKRGGTYTVSFDDSHLVSINPEVVHREDTSAVEAVSISAWSIAFVGREHSLDDSKTVSFASFERDREVVVERDVLVRGKVRISFGRIDEKRVRHGLCHTSQRNGS